MRGRKIVTVCGALVVLLLVAAVFAHRDAARGFWFGARLQVRSAKGRMELLRSLNGKAPESHRGALVALVESSKNRPVRDLAILLLAGMEAPLGRRGLEAILATLKPRPDGRSGWLTTC